MPHLTAPVQFLTTIAVAIRQALPTALHCKRASVVQRIPGAIPSASLAPMTKSQPMHEHGEAVSSGTLKFKWDIAPWIVWRQTHPTPCFFQVAYPFK
mgnify:CR=1 FL=1|jgi:hypothetical protein